jgi:hypothetical protein
MRAYPASLLALLLLASAAARADDPTLVWRTIETPHFYVHYYKSARHDLRQLAHELARSAEAAHAVLAPALGHAPGTRTHVVLTDDTDGANGSAQSVPMNIVRLYATAPSSLSTLNDYDDWLYGLVLHEYTHILHIDTIGGLPRIVNYVFGKTWAPNQIQPRWFIEGLATYYESARSAGGRLRSSVFDMYLRMAVLEGKLLEIDQITSSTRIFPRGNVAYLYGSQFVKYIADRFGERPLAEISRIYGRQVVPWSINRAVKQATGHTYLELYQDFKQHLRHRYELVRAAVASRGLTPYRRVTDDGDYISAPLFSRDGGELVYAHSDGHSQVAIKVMDTASGRVKERFELFGGSGLDLTPDARHIVYGEASVWRTFYSYDDLYVRTRASGRVRRLTYGMRAREPAVSPDGRQVAYVANDLGTSKLVLIPFEGGSQRVLVRGVRGEQIYRPRWSPDGRMLVYSLWKPGGYRDIHLLELASGRGQALTSDRALDVDPSFSADGKRIYFASDRTGIFNIYCLELHDRRLHQVSNVLGGAMTPAVSPDERTIYYVGFEAKGYDLHAMASDRRRFLPALPYVDARPASAPADATLRARPAQRGGAEPPPARYPERPYSPLPTLYPRSWSLNVLADQFGTVLGVELGGADVVGRHRWALATNVSTVKGWVSYGVGYSYNRLWPSIALDTSRFLGVRGGIVEDGVKRNYVEENYGAGLGIGLPVLRLVNHQGTISLGYRFNWFRAGEGSARAIVEPGMLSPRYPEQGILAGLSVGLSYASLQRYTWSISSSDKGRVLNLSLRVDHPALGSDYQSTQLTYSWNEYLPLRWWRDHVLALRLAGGIGSGSIARRGIFFLGGFPEQDVLRAFLESTRVGGAFLRGYPPGAVYGDQYHLLNVEYRFPLFDVERGFSTLPLYFTHIHAAVFVDAGNAFFGDIKLSDLKVGVGAELLFEGVIGYFIGSTFRLGYARGLMEPGGNAFHFLIGYPF